MKVLKRLDLNVHSWLKNPALVRLLDILNQDGLKVRMVGGCVRDTILGRDISDIDLASSLSPEEAMARLEKADVKVIPTGLKHGTITAVMDKNNFEITTLRRDEETDGRHATVAFTDNWGEDAKRRDFTYNALYLDGDGSLYDPLNEPLNDPLKQLGSGFGDVMARRTRFIGNAEARIKEDALRILRFFRFSAQIGQGELDPEGLSACIAQKNLIDNLSGERLAQELFKTLKADYVIPIMAVMAECGILDKILPMPHDLKKFKNFVTLEKTLGRCDILGRLSCLLVKGGQNIGRHLKLSNKQSNILARYGGHDVIITQDMSEKNMRKAIYDAGRDVFIFALLEYWAKAEMPSGRDMLHYAENWPIPIFPLSGRTLIKAGRRPGPKLGQTLKNIEGEWVDSDFTLTKQELYKRARAF